MTLSTLGADRTRAGDRVGRISGDRRAGAQRVHGSEGPKLLAMGPRVAGLLAVFALAAMLLPAGARADGDPASDVLLGESVFYPYTPQVSAAIQKNLNAATAAAARAHFPLKVALIASPVDLGVIPYMFGKPQMYANFLDQEISFQGKQPLLVVMWNGYGVQGLDRRATAAVASLRMPAGKPSDDLATAAIAAVEKLAGAAGHPIGAVAGSGSGGSGGSATTLILVALIAAALGTSITIVVVRRRHAALRG